MSHWAEAYVEQERNRLRLFGPELGDSEYAVLRAIARLMDASGVTESSTRKLAVEAGRSPRCVTQQLAKLRARGLLAMDYVRCGHQYPFTRYRFPHLPQRTLTEEHKVLILETARQQRAYAVKLRTRLEQRHRKTGAWGARLAAATGERDG